MCLCERMQRYIWWKKSIDVWTKDHPFPIDIDYMISDTLELLRPKMRLSCSLDEATKQVTDLEREVLVKLGICDYLNVQQIVIYISLIITACVNHVCACVAASFSGPGTLSQLNSILRCVGRAASPLTLLCLSDRFSSHTFQTHTVT